MFPNVLSPVRNNRCVFKVQYKETFLRDSWVHVHPHFRALSGLDNWEEKDLGNQRLSSSYISELTQQDGRGKKTAKLVSPSFCKETRGGVELSRLFSQANFITNWDFSNGISLGCGSSSKYLSLSSLTTQAGWYRIDGNNVVFFQNRQDYLKDEELTFERHSGIPITVVKEEQFSIQLQAAIGI